jgi:hypothetical protein
VRVNLYPGNYALQKNGAKIEIVSFDEETTKAMASTTKNLSRVSHDEDG